MFKSSKENMKLGIIIYYLVDAAVDLVSATKLQNNSLYEGSVDPRALFLRNSVYDGRIPSFTILVNRILTTSLAKVSANMSPCDLAILPHTTLQQIQMI
jgi:hypothetical protein